MVQWREPYQLHSNFTQKKDAPPQRGEGARGLFGLAEQWAKSKAALRLGWLL